MKTVVVNTGRALKFTAGVATIEVDMVRNQDGTIGVTLGAPFNANIRTTSVNGRKRYMVSAPHETLIEKVMA